MYFMSLKSCHSIILGSTDCSQSSNAYSIPKRQLSVYVFGGGRYFVWKINQHHEQVTHVYIVQWKKHILKDNRISSIPFK